MQVPLATVEATLADGDGRAVRVRLGEHTVVSDHPPSGPGVGASPLELMTASLAACSAMTTRTFLEREGDRGEVEVVVTMDGGPPSLLYRRVIVPVRLSTPDAHRLEDALERTEITMMLKPAFSIRTAIEHEGESLT